MTTNQTRLVQQTWVQLVPIADTAAELFYGRLFEIDPNLKSLFKTDIATQGKKLMQMIGMAVTSLEHLDRILPALKSLGTRHVAYGVKDQDYDTVASALLWTLEQGLGDAFTPEVKAAWTAVYDVLATTMKTAAATAPTVVKAAPPFAHKQHVF